MILRLEYDNDAAYGEYFVNGEKLFVVYQATDNKWCVALTSKGVCILVGKYDTFSQADLMVTNLYPHIKGS